MRFRYPFYVILGASGVQMRLKNHYNNFVYFLQNSTANYFRKFFLQEKILQQTILQKKTMQTLRVFGTVEGGSKISRKS